VDLQTTTAESWEFLKKRAATELGLDKPGSGSPTGSRVLDEEGVEVLTRKGDERFLDLKPQN